MEQLIDYTEHVSGSIDGAMFVHGQGKNVLILRKLDRPMRRFDGKMASYEVEYRWLSQECARESDQAWACVKGQERTYWQRKEIAKILKSGDMFGHFHLF